MPLRRSLLLPTLLVTVPLAVALVPLALPPWTYGLVVFRIAVAELGPSIALIALALGALAVALAPRRRPALALTALVTAALAVLPAVSAQRAARAGIGAVDALSLGAAAAHDPSPAPVVAGPNALLGAVLGLPHPPGVAERSVRYAAADGSPLTLRVYRDTLQAPGRPVVVAIYAGAWHDGDATQGAPLHAWLAAHGYVVVALDYRHAPSFRHPAQRDDVRGGLALVRDSAVAWGGDPSRVALLGRSSGGHLAMLGAWSTGASAPPLRVRGVVDFYGPFDLVRGYVDLPTPDPIDVRAVLRDFVGGPPDAMPTRYLDASPSSLVRPGLPPTLLVYAGRDHLVKPEFGRDAAAALRRSGVPVVYLELPWAEHGFDLAAGGPEGMAALGVVVRFLGRVL